MSVVTALGRPRKAENEKLVELMQFRLTAKEADLVYATALRSGLKVAEFLRLTVLSGLKQEG